jgi:hypothetical protein
MGVNRTRILEKIGMKGTSEIIHHTGTRNPLQEYR